MPTMTCPKCNGSMEEGFVVSRSMDFARPDDWVAGAPQSSLWYGTRTRDRPHYRLRSYRCEHCGFVESYAGPQG